MPSREILFLEWDGANETHLAEHGITPAEVRQMLDERHITRDNPKGPDGRIQLIGRTYGGRVLVILLDATSDPTIWRAFTGWPAAGDERKLFARYCR